MAYKTKAMSTNHALGAANVYVVTEVSEGTGIPTIPGT